MRLLPSEEDSVSVIWSPTNQPNRIDELEAPRDVFVRLNAPELTALQDADACTGVTIAACSPIDMPAQTTKRASMRRTGQWLDLNNSTTLHAATQRQDANVAARRTPSMIRARQAKPFSLSEIQRLPLNQG